MSRRSRSSLMKLFVICSNVPYRRDGQPGVAAVHIISAELLRCFRALGHELVLQPVFNVFRTTPTLQPSEREELCVLEEEGVTVLEPIYPSEYLAAGFFAAPAHRLRRFIGTLSGRARVQDYYAATRLKERMQERLRARGADAVLTIWSPEGVAATYGIRDLPKVAYHGDQDFHPVEVRASDHALFAATADEGRRRFFDGLRARVWLAGLKRAHLALMRDVDVVANIMAASAEFYARHGHPRSIYARSLWTDRRVEPIATTAAPSPAIGSPRTVKIIGHAGTLSATGSTYGLRFLLVDLLPHLEDAMAGVPYEVHIIGGGETVPALRPRLRHPRIVVRGFVKDLDQELLSSDMFFMLNNAGPYQGAHTRQIIAWSMGLCLVVHANARKAIAETRHLENALVGATPAELARLVRLAATDEEVNRRVRAGGRATYERYFTPQAVAQTLNRELLSLVGVN